MMEIIIASVRDREELVAEIWQENMLVAELSQEEGRLLIDIYPNPRGGPWSFQIDELLEVLQKAKSLLLQDT